MFRHDLVKTIFFAVIIGVIFIFLKFTDLKVLPFTLAQSIWSQVSGIDLLGQDAKIRNENETVISDLNFKITQLEKENKDLRTQLDIKITPQRQLAEGNLAYAGRSLFNRTLIVRLAQLEPVDLVNRAVIAPGNLFLGKVTKIDGQFIQAEFLDDVEASFSVVTAQTNLKGMTRPALGGIELRIAGGAQSLPQAGELVYTHTLDPDIPAGLLVGRVIISGPPEAPKVFIEPIVQPNDVERVFIIKEW